MNTIAKNSLTSITAAILQALFNRLAAFVTLMAPCGFMAIGRPASAQTSPLTWLGGFEGINSGWTPANPIIAAGPGSLVTMVNGKIAIFNKQGTKLFEQNLGAGGFWAAQGADLVIEPWVIFDPHSSRFIAVATDIGNKLGHVHLAVSNTSVPTGPADWYKHTLDLTGTHQDPGYAGEETAPYWPRSGVDAQALYITAQHRGKISGIYSHNHIIAVPKAPLLTGGAPNIPFPYEQSFVTWGPLHPLLVFDQLSPMYFVTQDPYVETVTIYALANALTSPDLTSSTTLSVPAFDQPPPVPQPGNGPQLTLAGSRFLSGVVRNGSLWTAHAILDPAVDNEAVVRWYEFDVSAFPGPAMLAQSGSVDPGPGIHTVLPAINVDADGNMGMVFSVASANQYAAIGSTGRLAGDPYGETYPLQIARNGEATYTAGGWGNYGGLAIDPNDQTFWLFHLYPTRPKGGSPGWRTFAGAFEVVPVVPLVDPMHCGDLDGTSANSGKNWKATVTVTIHDDNHAPVPGATVSIGWSAGGLGTGNPVTDANGRCTFASGAISKTIPNVTMTIAGATHATLTYNAAENHDPDGDSGGTIITVNKP